MKEHLLSIIRTMPDSFSFIHTCTRMATQLPPPLQISRITVEELSTLPNAILSLTVPFVIQGLTSEKPKNLWTKDYLMQKFGKEEYTIRNYPLPFGSGSLTWLKMTFQAYQEWLDAEELDKLANPSKVRTFEYYLAQVRLPELERDLELERHREWLPQNSQNMFWYAPSGHYEPLHVDLSPNLNQQLIGSKKFVLFGPHNYSNVYPSPNMILSSRFR